MIISQQVLVLARMSLIFKYHFNVAPEQLEQLEIHQSRLGKILGLGTWELKGTKSWGVGETAIKIYNVATPHQFEQQLWRFIKTNAQ